MNRPHSAFGFKGKNVGLPIKRREDKTQEKITPEQVIYNLSIYLQTNGQTIPPAFKSSLKYCLRLLAGSKLPEGKPPLLTPEERRNAFDRAETKWRADGRKEVYEFNTLWEYIAYEVAQAQRDSDIEWMRGEG